MFSQWRQNVKSLYFKVLTLSRLLPLTHQFTTSLWSCPKYYISLLLTVLDIFIAVQIQQKIDSLYFLNLLMCKLLLHCLPSTSGTSQVENVDRRGFGLSVCKLRLLQAKWSTLMFIIRTVIIAVYIYYTTLTTNIASNKVSCLLYFRTQCKQHT